MPIASEPDAATALREAAEAGTPVRIVGGGTKLGWGRPVEAEVEVTTAGLDRIVEHNAGDLTAVLEAGVPLAAAQQKFAEAGQMLALDPPADGATIGGVVSAGDSGPLRSRYGGPRDLVLGVRAALPDGNVIKSGGKVIKNVAGYDLGKLLAGSFGTLGAIVEVSVRLHPRPEQTATAAGGTTDSSTLAAAAIELSRSPLEHLCLDVRWGGGDGALLARFAGAAAREQAEAALRLMADAGLEGSLVEDDESVWSLQRNGQRSAGGTVVRVSGAPSRAAEVLAAATRLGARVVGRAGLGLSWMAIEERSADESVEAVQELRRELSPLPCVVLDAPRVVRERLDPWGGFETGLLELMRRLKDHFDPAGVLNPGLLP
ncbi:MAG: FAD-binding oxidoreductase [Thermoleophilaceae bacterium]